MVNTPEFHAAFWTAFGYVAGAGAALTVVLVVLIGLAKLVKEGP